MDLVELCHVSNCVMRKTVVVFASGQSLQSDQHLSCWSETTNEPRCEKTNVLVSNLVRHKNRLYSRLATSLIYNSLFFSV